MCIVTLAEISDKVGSPLGSLLSYLVLCSVSLALGLLLLRVHWALSFVPIGLSLFIASVELVHPIDRDLASAIEREQPGWHWKSRLAMVTPSSCCIIAFVPLARSQNKRRRIRSRSEAGQCRMCGYDLQFDYQRGCPECGWNIPADSF